MFYLNISFLSPTPPPSSLLFFLLSLWSSFHALVSSLRLYVIPVKINNYRVAKPANVMPFWVPLMICLRSMRYTPQHYIGTWYYYYLVIDLSVFMCVCVSRCVCVCCRFFTYGIGDADLSNHQLRGCTWLYNNFICISSKVRWFDESMIVPPPP